MRQAECVREGVGDIDIEGEREKQGKNWYESALFDQNSAENPQHTIKTIGGKNVENEINPKLGAKTIKNYKYWL